MAQRNNVVCLSGADGGTVKVLDVAELVAERLKWIIFIFDAMEALSLDTAPRWATIGIKNWRCNPNDSQTT